VGSQREGEKNTSQDEKKLKGAPVQKEKVLQLTGKVATKRVTLLKELIREKDNKKRVGERAASIKQTQRGEHLSHSWGGGKVGREKKKLASFSGGGNQKNSPPGDLSG